MVEFEIKSKVQPLGKRKGQTVYYAMPKSKQKLTYKMLLEYIVNETSLSYGDVSNALISLSNIVSRSLKQGMSVDLADLGMLRLSIPPKMMDTPEEVTAKGALKKPRIIFSPKQSMREAAEKVECVIDRSRITPASSATTPETPGGGTTTDPETPGTGGTGSGDEFV